MKILASLALLLLVSDLSARSAQDFLPADADPDPAIPTPESVLGWEVGDWHVSHDKLVQYMQTLAASSPRVSIKVIGQTYEQRPLLQLAITSVENQEKLETLRTEHLAGRGPLVIWLGYSVHGNEASGSNASMLTAYYLASSRSAFVNELLDGGVVLIDPSINPDGLNRFASWANSNAGRNPVADPITRQHAENWPGGRTNHYWFDLNRDWLPLVHPSSRARISEYHKWLPHVLTDHHEQTGYPGFFFQPGVPTRQNPLTPLENLELTRALAAFHSAALDQVGQPHFTEDAYDDFYYGKGSTYPDINGSIGILFEQKAIRGQALDTSNGTETFRMAIANQLRVSLSTLNGSWAIRDRLQAYQAGFHDGMLERARDQSFAGWVIGDDGDPARAQALLEMLSLHQVEYRALAETIRAEGYEFTRGHAWIVPARQRQFGLIEAMMEQRTRFEDDTFYDVSAWTLPLAYNLPFARISRIPDSEENIQSSNGLTPDKSARAWVIPWNQLEAPAVLQTLLTDGVRVRTATRAFSAQTGSGLKSLRPGALMIQAGVQDPEVLEKTIATLGKAALAGLDIYSLNSSLTTSGPDLGAKHFKPLRPVSPLILGGKGASSYGVGEQWFLLDQRLGLPAPISEITNFEKVDLANYTHLLMADGNYDGLNNGHKERIVRWIEAGGILVAVGQASTWAEGLCFEADEEACDITEPVIDSEPFNPRAYSDFADDKAKLVIGGAIVDSVIDLSHPIAFGYQRTGLALFRRGTVELEPANDPYSTPVRYTADPLMAGFIGDERLAAMKNQPAVIADKRADGLMVRFANTPLFRGFWRGTEKLFINALYFGQVVESTKLPEFMPAPNPETPRHK
jgi:hypothetical protein